MNIKEFTIISNYDGLPLKGVVYEPNGTPKGIVHLVHGMVEYKGRYKHVLQFFAESILCLRLILCERFSEIIILCAIPTTLMAVTL